MEPPGIPRAVMREIPEMVDNTVSEIRAVDDFAGTDARRMRCPRFEKSSGL